MVSALFLMFVSKNRKKKKRILGCTLTPVNKSHSKQNSKVGRYVETLDSHLMPIDVAT